MDFLRSIKQEASLKRRRQHRRVVRRFNVRSLSIDTIIS